MNASKCAIVCCICLVLVLIVLINRDKMQPQDEVISITSLLTDRNHESTQATNREVLRFLESVRLEKMHLKDATFEDAVKFLIKKINANPQSGRVDFIVRVPNSSLMREESLNIDNVTAFEALKAIGEKYQVAVGISRQAVIFEQ